MENYDAVAPIQTRWVKHPPHALVTATTFERLNRKSEDWNGSTYRKSGLTVDKQLFEDKCLEDNGLLDSCKKNYYKSKIQQAHRNQLFILIDQLFTTPSTKLPIHESFNCHDQLGQELITFLSIRFEI